MGLTAHSTGRAALHSASDRQQGGNSCRRIALAGNPNVGKSTVFNGLTGMKQHTGNWPGKTVSLAEGRIRSEKGEEVRLIDLPGTYSLMAHSPEEEVARDLICFGEVDRTVVVCDATCLERNLILVLQILEGTRDVLVCLNLMDEAKRRQIEVSPAELSRVLGVPVVGITARRRGDLDALRLAILSPSSQVEPYSIVYPPAVEEAIERIETVLEGRALRRLRPRWLALQLLLGDESLQTAISSYCGDGVLDDPVLQTVLTEVLDDLTKEGLDADRLRDAVAGSAVEAAHALASSCVRRQAHPYGKTDRRLDRILTGRRTAYPIMLLLLLFVFFLTITVSNIPSSWLSSAFGWMEERLRDLFLSLQAPPWLTGLLVDGMFRTLGWVVSVMLPPMAIFFPLFTLLEDAGYLPRIAYNLDRPFCRCNACGKQALTMSMGFGCNAAGVVGCRIIESPRERLLAILTNSLVPCNGRFPALISLITLFFLGASTGLIASLRSALLLTLVILLAILMTFAATKLLSVTLLRGMPSSFTLEMPPFRPPQVGRVILRSIFDRTLYVLGRAVTVAIPAGLLIWVMANVTVQNATLLAHCASFLEPLGHLMGVDGIILMAFLLGLPANEIVIPIMLMAYRSAGSMTEMGDLSEVGALLTANGWTRATALSVILLFLFHSPCATTLLTIHKETGSLKWTVLSAVLPSLLGILLTVTITALLRLFGAA